MGATDAPTGRALAHERGRIERRPDHQPAPSKWGCCFGSRTLNSCHGFKRQEARSWRTRIFIVVRLSSEERAQITGPECSRRCQPCCVVQFEASEVPMRPVPLRHVLSMMFFLVIAPLPLARAQDQVLTNGKTTTLLVEATSLPSLSIGVQIWGLMYLPNTSGWW